MRVHKECKHFFEWKKNNDSISLMNLIFFLTEKNVSKHYSMVICMLIWQKSMVKVIWKLPISSQDNIYFKISQNRLKFDIPTKLNQLFDIMNCTIWIHDDTQLVMMLIVLFIDGLIVEHFK